MIKQMIKDDEEKTLANTRLDKKVKEKTKALEEEKAKNDEKDATIEELKRQIADLNGMLDQSQGYKHMVNKIDEQKKVTRDALSYIAEVKRDRSMFKTPNNSICVDRLEAVSIENTQTELDKMDNTS